MHGGKCYDIKMMKARRDEERTRKINNFFIGKERAKDAFLFILFALWNHPDSELVPLPAAGMRLQMRR